MRKLALLTVILLTVCLTGAFAEVTGIGAPTASGSVSVTIGYDLDNEGFGFVNDSSVTVTMPLADGSAMAGGSDDMYGEITISDIGWSIEDGKGFYDADEDADGGAALHAAISAKLVIAPLEIGLGQPDFAINNVDVSDSYVVDASADGTDTGGISIGYVTDMISVTGMIATIGDYRDAGDVDDAKTEDEDAVPFDNDVQDEQDAGDAVTTNVDANMVFGASFSVAPADGITIDGAFMMQPDFSGSDALMGVGANIAVAMDPLTLTIPIDFVSVGSKSGFEVDPTVSFAIMENLTLDANFLFGSYSEVMAADVDPTVDAAATEVENAVAGAGLTVTDAGAIVDGLEWTVAFALVDMMDYLGLDADMQWDLDVDASFNAGGLKPYVNFGTDEASVVDFGVGVELGADFTGIDNTVITADFTNEGDEDGRITLDITVSL